MGPMLIVTMTTMVSTLVKGNLNQKDSDSQGLDRHVRVANSSLELPRDDEVQACINYQPRRFLNRAVKRSRCP